MARMIAVTGPLDKRTRERPSWHRLQSVIPAARSPTKVCGTALLLPRYLGILIPLVLLWCCGAFWAATISAGGQLRTDKQPGPDLSNEQLARAKTVFLEKCARCHGPDGQGRTVLGSMLKIPNFTDSAFWRDDVNNRRLINTVTNGKNEMPAFGKKLTRAEINSLVAYVRRFSRSATEKQNSSR